MLTKASSSLPAGVAAAATAIKPVATTLSSSRRPFSVLDRPPPNYPGHVPLTHVERAGLALGSGIMSFINPYRGGVFSSLRIHDPAEEPS